MEYLNCFDLNKIKLPKETRQQITNLSPKQRKSLNNYIYNDLGGDHWNKELIVSCIEEFLDKNLNYFIDRSDFITYYEEFDILDFPFRGKAYEIVKGLTYEEKLKLGDYIVDTLETVVDPEEIEGFVEDECELFIKEMRKK